MSHQENQAVLDNAGTSTHPMLQDAIKALSSREYYAAFQENPSPKVYGETADPEGKAAFEAFLNTPFPLTGWNGPRTGREISPYTGQPLGISYPQLSADLLVEKAESVRKTWMTTPRSLRNSVLLDSLKRLEKRFFELAYATMHTTGQGYMMAFQASGPHAADRALEALAVANMALDFVPEGAHWEKNLGKFSVALKKEWKAQPFGIGLVIGCSTFPTWNSMPGLYASLAVGAPVIVKPHPMAILPLAIVVDCLRASLEEAGLPADICQLAADTQEKPLSKELAQHPKVKMIDYTGGPAFGNWLETLPGKILFTEKAGINCAIVESAKSIDEVVQNLAFSVSLYSGQMCTAPHHILIPAEGVRTEGGQVVSFDDFVQKFSEGVNGLVQNPKAGPFVLGAIQNEGTVARIANESIKGNTILDGSQVLNPQFENARTLSPRIKVVDATAGNLPAEELFGPSVLLVKTPDAQTAIDIAKKMALEVGAISGAAYSTDEGFISQAAEELNEVGVPMSFNLSGPIYMNQNAAFSDLHVTGGNNAGNGSITDLSFVSRRFFWVGNKYMTSPQQA